MLNERIVVVDCPLGPLSLVDCCCLQTFPVSQKERQMLMAKLSAKTDKANEPRDDIRVPCTRIVTQLNKQVCKPCVRYGMVWYGMVWYAVWYGMV